MPAGRARSSSGTRFETGGAHSPNTPLVGLWPTTTYGKVLPEAARASDALLLTLNRLLHSTSRECAGFGRRTHFRQVRFLTHRSDSRNSVGGCLVSPDFDPMPVQNATPKRNGAGTPKQTLPELRMLECPLVGRENLKN